MLYQLLLLLLVAPVVPTAATVTVGVAAALIVAVATPVAAATAVAAAGVDVTAALRQPACWGVREYAAQLLLNPGVSDATGSFRWVFCVAGSSSYSWCC